MAIGQKLEEARKRKGISLREASESTKIRGDYLSAFESDQFDLNLPEVYLRGFVRTYAAYLDLDQEAIIAELEIGVGKTKLRNTKKSLGSIAAGEIPETSEIRSSGQSKAKGNFSSENHFNLRKPLIFVTAGISLLIITIVFFTFIDFSNEKEKISPLTNDDLDEQTVQEIKKVGSSVIQSDSHLLRIKAVGPNEGIYGIQSLDRGIGSIESAEGPYVLGFVTPVSPIFGQTPTGLDQNAFISDGFCPLFLQIAIPG